MTKPTVLSAKKNICLRCFDNKPLICSSCNEKSICDTCYCVNCKARIRFDDKYCQACYDKKANPVYRERNNLAIAFAKMAISAGFEAGIGYDSDSGKDWDPEWRNVVYVDLPDNKQVSWHMHDSDAEIAKKILPVYSKKWDGTALGKQKDWPTHLANLAQQTEFYCAVNIDQVPKDAVGKEWEFSDRNNNWAAGKLISSGWPGSYCFTAEIRGREENFLFMRPVTLKRGDICRTKCSALGRYLTNGKALFVSAQDNDLGIDDAISAEENPLNLPLPSDEQLKAALKKLNPGKRMSITEAQQALIDKLNEENCRLVTVMHCEKGRHLFIARSDDWGYEKAYTKYLVEKELNCEVVIDE